MLGIEAMRSWATEEVRNPWLARTPVHSLMTFKAWTFWFTFLCSEMRLHWKTVWFVCLFCFGCLRKDEGCLELKILLSESWNYIQTDLIFKNNCENGWWQAHYATNDFEYATNRVMMPLFSMTTGQRGRVPASVSAELTAAFTPPKVTTPREIFHLHKRLYHKEQKIQ